MPAPEKLPERNVNPRTANHGDLVQYLRENGITTLDDLVQYALQQAQSAGTEAELWALVVADKYVIAGTN